MFGVHKGTFATDGHFIYSKVKRNKQLETERLRILGQSALDWRYCDGVTLESEAICERLFLVLGLS